MIALVGDGALSGGEAFEGLNNAAALGSNIILIINDNDMSIAENHGGLYQNLRLLRETEERLTAIFFGRWALPTSLFGTAIISTKSQMRWNK